MSDTNTTMSITLRDWRAMFAMNGIMANQSFAELPFRRIAKAAYDIADAMEVHTKMEQVIEVERSTRKDTSGDASPTGSTEHTAGDQQIGNSGPRPK